jgi:acid phosphatase (class A)
MKSLRTTKGRRAGVLGRARGRRFYPIPEDAANLAGGWPGVRSSMSQARQVISLQGRAKDHGQISIEAGRPTVIRSAVLTVAVLAALVGCATPPQASQALETAQAPTDAARAAPVPTTLTGYLSAGALDGKTILGPPPAVDSAQGRAERQNYDDTRALAGTPRWETAIQDNDLWTGGAFKRFACGLGRDLSEARTPTTLRILHRIELDVRTVGTPAKDFYARVRPAIGNDKPICVPREAWMKTNASYPSGHAMAGWAWALVLTELQPATADAVLKVGREVGESRVICGVHFQSDIEAGRTLSAAMVARLHADPAFTADMARARRELAAAPAPQGCQA